MRGRGVRHVRNVHGRGVLSAAIPAHDSHGAPSVPGGHENKTAKPHFGMALRALTWPPGRTALHSHRPGASSKRKPFRYSVSGSVGRSGGAEA